MSYTARVYYVLESDVSYTLKYITPSDGSITVGDSFVLQMSDFDYNNKHYYVKYAINNGDVYLRGKDGSIIANTMVISEDGNFANWFVFCTEYESEITGDSIVSMEDIASEIVLQIGGSTLSTKGSEYINSIDITQGCLSESFASYGSTYSPTINCDMFSCEFTDAIISKAYVNNSFNGTLIYAYLILDGHDYNPIPYGLFVVKENPVYNGETVSFTGNGLMSEYMDIAEIEISALNKYHEEELENKYVKTGYMDFISYDSDSYFWEFLPEDFLRVTGSPLHIDNWSDILSAIGTYGLQQLMIPVVASSSYDDDTHTYDTEYNSRITWRELLSGIAVLLRGNVIEKNGAFYIKRLPEVKQDGYRPIFDASMYDSSAIFGNNLMSPSNISVKANNWWPYTSKDQKHTYPIGFGYCEGESTVVLNDSVSSIQNVESYPVTIECPWILFETLNRNTNQGHDWYTFIGNDRAMNWQTGLKTLNRAFVYHKATFETTSWHPLMSVGDIIIVEDHDGVKRYVFVGEMTLHYNGTVYAEITSPCEVQETNTSSVGGGGSTSYNSGTTAQASGTTMGTMLGAIFKDGVITNSKIADSTITGSKIAESTIENSNIKDSTITGSKFEDGTIENSKIKDSTLTGAKIADATIGFEKVDTSFIENLTADKAYIDNLTARIGDFGFITADSANLKYATIESLQATDGRIDTLESKAITTDNLEAEVATLGYLSAESADVKFATIESLTAVDGKIDTLSSKAITTENLSAKVADLGYLSADSAEISYAKIDFSNVGTQVVSSSMIIDGAVTNEKVGNLSANKITSGTIDASKITVTNLNADNLTVGTINGKLIGNGSVDLDKLSQEVPTKEYLDNVQKELQGQIDGAIETFTKSEIPTLNNEPANAWTDNETRKKHIGDVCYVLNPLSSADGYCYRFANIGTEASPQYKWVLIKDSDVTKALQDIIDINGEITGIKQFDTEISSWKNDTDAELSSIKSRTTTLETDIGTKVETSVFNELKQTVDENSSSITSLSTTVSKKADSSTVTDLTNTVNSVKQTADRNTSSISSMQTTISGKADSSTVTALSNKTSELEQSLNGFKTTVSETYATKTALSAVETIATQTADKFSWLVKSGTSATNFELTDRTANLVANQINLNGLVTFSGLGSDAQNKINTAQSTADTAKSNAAAAQAKADSLGIVHTFDGNGNSNMYAEFADITINGTYINVPISFRVSSRGYESSDVQLCFKAANSKDPELYYLRSNGNVPLWIQKIGTSKWRIITKKSEPWGWFRIDNYCNPLEGAVSVAWVGVHLESIPDGSIAADRLQDGRAAQAANNTIADWCYNNDKTYINGGKIYTGSITAKQISSGAITTDKLAANAVTAEKINVKDLFAQDITAEGTITGATLIGAHVESTSGSIGGFDIGEDSLSLSGTDRDSTFYTGLTNKTLNGDAFGALTSYWKMSGAGTAYGGYVQISHGGIEAGTISGTTPTYTPSFRVSGDSITIGDIASLEIKNNEIIGIFDGTTPTIVTRTLTLNAMSLAGNYDGETSGKIESVRGYVVLAVIPRTSDATDVCWINCYFDSSNFVHARLKNTASSAKNNFKPTVEVLYRLI